MSSDTPEFQEPEPSAAGTPQPGVQGPESQPSNSQQQGYPQNPPVGHGGPHIPHTPQPGYPQPTPGYTHPQPGYTHPQHTPPGYNSPQAATPPLSPGDEKQIALLTHV